MSEEEKKAIKWFDTERKLVEITNGDNNYFSIILNLIDKLQKENEELKRKTYKAYINDIGEVELVFDNYISKDKIRDKIKDLEGTISFGLTIEVLKELLGE